MKRRIRGLAGNLDTSDIWLLGSVFLLLLLGSIVVYGAGSYTNLARATPLGQYTRVWSMSSGPGIGRSTV